MMRGTHVPPWVDTFSRDRADLGPSHAAELAGEEASKYAMTPEPSPSPQDRLPRVGRPKPLFRTRRIRGIEGRESASEWHRSTASGERGRISAPGLCAHRPSHIWDLT